MSFEQGLSGLNAANSNLSAIGNNVANANTVGFKQSQAQFADMFANSISGAGGVAGQVGSGVSVSAIAQQFTQGNITATSNPMDTAISGQGFFQMTNTAGATVYSRNGQFSLDKNGFMVNAQGEKVNGYMPNSAGAIITGSVVPLQINSANMKANPSTTATVGVNLNSAAAVPFTATFSPSDPTSYTNSTSMSVIDSQGNTHVGTMYFARQPLAVAALGNASIATTGVMTLTGSTAGLSVGNTITVSGVTYTVGSITSGNTLTVTPIPGAAVPAAAPTATNAPTNTWNAYLTVDGASVPPIILPAAATVLTTLTFDTSGILTSPTAAVPSASFYPSGATAAQTVTINFDSSTSPSTQVGNAFSVNTLTQNGYGSGQLTKTNTGADGTITGTYSNGQTRALGQIILANFTAPQGLQSIGGNDWIQTATSGSPLVGVPGTGSLGSLQSSATEDSNVDLTAALVNMITAQRVYQANAQTIKTEDQLLQTIVNLR